MQRTRTRSARPVVVVVSLIVGLVAPACTGDADGEPTFNVQETYRHEVNGTSFVHTRTWPAEPAAVFPGVYSATTTTIRYFEARGGEVWDEFYFERVE